VVFREKTTPLGVLDSDQQKTMVAAGVRAGLGLSRGAEVVAEALSTKNR